MEYQAAASLLNTAYAPDGQVISSHNCDHVKLMVMGVVYTVRMAEDDGGLRITVERGSLTVALTNVRRMLHVDYHDDSGPSAHKTRNEALEARRRKTKQMAVARKRDRVEQDYNVAVLRGGKVHAFNVGGNIHELAQLNTIKGLVKDAIKDGRTRVRVPEASVHKFLTLCTRLKLHVDEIAVPDEEVRRCTCNDTEAGRVFFRAMNGVHSVDCPLWTPVKLS